MRIAPGIVHRSRSAFSNTAGGVDVLIATVNRPEGDTGVHSHTRALSSGLVKAGVGCRIVSPFTDTCRWLPVFAVRRLLLKNINKTWGTRWYRYWHQRALRERLCVELSRRTPAALIAQCPLSAAAAIDARDALHLDFPVALVCHFNYSEATEYREKGELSDQSAFDAMLAMESDVLRHVDSVFYVSQWCRRAVEEDRGIVPRASSVIWNGIDTNVAAGPVDRMTLGATNEDLLLINVGSIEARKNQIGLLDLFARVAGEFPTAKLILVGDGVERSKVEAKIAALGLQGRVHCLGFRTDVPSIFAAADLYVHYARLENCPVILLEAARAGLPIASLPAGGAVEILNALGGGVLLTPDDLEASMKSLRPVLWERSTRRSMGTLLRRGFEARFTQDAMVRDYLRQLNALGADVPVEGVSS